MSSSEVYNALMRIMSGEDFPGESCWNMALNLSDYKTEVHNDWCPRMWGLWYPQWYSDGPFGDGTSEALRLSYFSGIGCSGKTPDNFINTYGIHTLHGRVLPFSRGANLSESGGENRSLLSEAMEMDWE